MNEKKQSSFTVKKRRKKLLTPFSFIKLDINKRQRYIIGVVFLSLGLFISEYLLGKSGFALSVILAILTDIFILWANHDDIKENKLSPIFILPFFFSLSFALFYFLIPNRLLARIIITSLYAVGLYSLFLSQNIFTVASIRTIALLSSARTVSFILTLVSYFFLANIIFSLDFSLIPTSILLLIFSFFLILHSIWTYTLDQKFFSQFLWILFLSLCIIEISAILWFWPSNPTIIALFLTGFFYTLVGLSHVWFEKRLFRGIIWEYVWVAVIVSLILVFSTSWRG